MDSAADGTVPGPALTYEQARAGLEEVVRTLEAGGTSLEESLELWQRGESLAAACQRFLDGARARLEAARSAEQGAASEE
jgi:exodeoxyribonuclease VII small subunit